MAEDRYGSPWASFWSLLRLARNTGFMVATMLRERRGFVSSTLCIIDTDRADTNPWRYAPPIQRAARSRRNFRVRHVGLSDSIAP